MDEAEVFRFHRRRQGIEISFIKPTVSSEWIDREVAYSERGQILKEMRALARVYPILLQSALHNQVGIRDIRPFYRDTEPWVAASPPTGADKYETFFLFGKLTVDFLYFVGNLLVV